MRAFEHQSRVYLNPWFWLMMLLLVAAVLVNQAWGIDIVLKKNEAAYLAIPMVDSAAPEDFATGLTVTDTCYYKDGAGSWTSLAVTDTFSEIGATGLYEIDLTASELNHDQVICKLTATGAADSAVILHLYPNDVDDCATPAEVDTECDEALTNYDPPTDTEMDAAFAGLNDLSAAEVNAECDTALTDYDAVVPADLPANFSSLDIDGNGRVDVYQIEGVDASTEIRNKADEAIVINHLDHLLQVADDDSYADNSIIAKLASSTGDWTTYAAADDSAEAVSGAIAGLNDLSAAAVNAEVDTALADYDGPTNAEMEARTLVAASYFDPAADNVTVGTINTGVITADAIAADAIGASELATTAADEISDEVWDEAIADHTSAGTTGEALDDAPQTAIFITGFTNAGSGSVSNITYWDSGGTTPANKVLTGGESDDDSVTFTVEIHVLGDDWQHESVSLYCDGSPEGAAVDRANWTQLDDRVFQVSFTDSGASANATYRVQTDDAKGVSANFAYVRGLDPPEILTAGWNGTYPTSPETGLQTAVKSGDTVTVTGTVETHATRITVIDAGASSTTQHFDDDYSSGSFSISVTIGSRSGSQQFTLKANKDGGAYGSEFATTDSPAIVLDQASHSYGSFTNLVFEGTNFALRSDGVGDEDVMTGDLTISNWSAGNDVIAYTSSEVTITDSTTYAVTKTYTYLAGTYRDSGTNVTLTSRRKANGKQDSTTYLVKICNAAATLTMTGATARLQSQATGGDKTYNLTLTSNYELKSFAATRDAGDDGDALGAWSGSPPDKTWTNTIAIGEEDTKNVGAAYYTWAGVSAYTGSGLHTTTINTNPNYTVGGFTERRVNLAQYDEYEPIGTMCTDQGGVNADVVVTFAVGAGVYVDEWDNVTKYPGERKFTIVDSGGSFDADGDYVRCLDSNIYNAAAYYMDVEEVP